MLLACRNLRLSTKLLFPMEERPDPIYDPFCLGRILIVVACIAGGFIGVFGFRYFVPSKSGSTRIDIVYALVAAAVCFPFILRKFKADLKKDIEKAREKEKEKQNRK